MTHKTQRMVQLRARINESTIALRGRNKRRIGARGFLRGLYREGCLHHCQEIRAARAELFGMTAGTGETA